MIHLNEQYDETQPVEESDLAVCWWEPIAAVLAVYSLIVLVLSAFGAGR